MQTITATGSPPTLPLRAANWKRSRTPPAPIRMRSLNQAPLSQNARHSASTFSSSCGATKWSAGAPTSACRGAPISSHIAALTDTMTRRSSSSATGLVEPSNTAQKSCSQSSSPARFPGIGAA